MLIHDVFFTQAIPSFDDATGNKIVFQVDRDNVRTNKGSVDIRELQAEFLPLIVPIIRRTIDKEVITITNLLRNNNLLLRQIKTKMIMEQDQAALRAQYERSIHNKNKKIEALVKILDKIKLRLASTDSMEKAVTQVLK